MYKHYDKDGAAISLHDCCAEKATFENGVLAFYFPGGFRVCPNHEANPTGESEWTLAELVSALNSGRYKLDFLYRYEGGYKEQVFTCEICQKRKPYRRECRLWLSVRDVMYCWKKLFE